MKYLFLFFLFCQLLFSADFYGYGIISHLAYGEYWRTTLIITNKSKTQPSLTSIDFFESNGNMANLTFRDDAGNVYIANNNLGVRLPPLASIRLETINLPPQTKTGWAQFYSVEGEADVFVVFRATFPPAMNRSDFEAVVFSEVGYEHEILIPFNNKNGFETAVALVNFGNMPTNLEIKIIDETGTIIGTYNETLAAQNQTAFQTASRWPLSREKSGSIYIFGSHSAFTGLTLLFNPSLSMTSSTVLSVKR
jgi:hypothetical protein